MVRRKTPGHSGIYKYRLVGSINKSEVIKFVTEELSKFAGEDDNAAQFMIRFSATHNAHRCIEKHSAA